MKIQALILILLIANVSADVIFEADELQVDVLEDDSETIQIEVINEDNQSYQDIEIEVKGEAEDWIDPYISVFNIDELDNRTLIFDVEPGADPFDNYEARILLKHNSFISLINLIINYSEKPPEYYRIGSEERYSEEDSIYLSETGYEIYVQEIDNNDARLHLIQDGDTVEKQWCDENEVTLLNEEIKVDIGKTRNDDYVEITIYSTNEDDEIDSSSNVNIVMDSQPFSVNQQFCLDDVTNKYEITRVGYSMVAIKKYAQTGPLNYECYKNQKCLIDDLDITLERVDDYDWSTGSGTAVLSMVSRSPHFATNCGGSGTTTTQITGELIMNIVSGKIEPDGIVYLSISDKNYNTVRQGTVSVDANTKEPLTPQAISSDGMVKINLPPNMKCPVKITALVEGASPSTMFPSCSDQGRLDVENYTNEGSRQLKINVASLENTNQIVVGDGVIISVETLDGRVVSGAQVTIRDPSGILTNQPWPTDSRGQMTFTADKTGKWRTRAVKDGYQSSEDKEFEVLSKTMTVSYTPGSTVKVGDEVTLLVRDTVTNSLMNSIPLTASKPSGSLSDIPVTTDNSAQITFTPDISGTYSFTIREREYTTLTAQVKAENREMTVNILPAEPVCGNRITWEAHDTVDTSRRISTSVKVDGETTIGDYYLPPLNKKYSLEFSQDQYTPVTLDLDIKCEVYPPDMKDSYGKNKRVYVDTELPLLNPKVMCGGVEVPLKDITDKENTNSFYFVTPEQEVNCTFTADNMNQDISFEAGRGFKLELPEMPENPITVLIAIVVLGILLKNRENIPVLKNIGSPSRGGGRLKLARSMNGETSLSSPAQSPGGAKSIQQ